MPLEECYLDPGYGKPVHVFPMGSRICQCGGCDCTERPPSGMYSGRRKRKVAKAAEDFDREAIPDAEDEREKV